MYQYPDYLMHYGIPGMKWGVRKKDYSSTSVRAAMARRQNDKVDAGFKNWNSNSKKKENAIDLGKSMNTNRMAYESNRNRKIAAVKRGLTMSAKAAATTAAVGGGLYLANKYGVLNTSISSDDVIRYAKVGKKILTYMY